MTDAEFTRAILSVAILGFLVPAGFWYFGIRLGKPQLKVWGVVIAVMFFSAASFNLAHDQFDFFPNTYSTYFAGPGARDGPGPLLVDGPYRVNVAGSRNEVVLTPISNYKEAAPAPVTIGVEIQSPSGQVVHKGRTTLLPARRTDWVPWKTEFTAAEEGEYKVILEIPRPVRKVHVELTERKK